MGGKVFDFKPLVHSAAEPATSKADSALTRLRSRSHVECHRGRGQTTPGRNRWGRRRRQVARIRERPPALSIGRSPDAGGPGVSENIRRRRFREYVEDPTNRYWP